VDIKQTAAFHAKMAQQRFHRHAGDTKAQVHLHHDWRHWGPERHLRHPVIVRDVKAPKQKVCHLDMFIYILLFPALNFSIQIHTPWIASVRKILIQIW